MTARSKTIAALSLALAWGCSRPAAEPVKAPVPPAKADFLQEVVKARLQMAADDAHRISAMIRREDAIMLTNQIERLGQYRMAAVRLDPAGVDPKVARLRQGFVALLDAYRFVCLDTAELFREVAALDLGRAGRPPLAPALLAAMNGSRGGTVAALDSLLGALAGLDTKPQPGGINLAPIIGSVRSDHAALKQALAAQKDLESKVRLPAGG
jgi:hypothetical protein